MFSNRSRCTGAYARMAGLILLVTSLLSSLPASARIAPELEKEFQTIESKILEITRKPVDERKKPLNALDKKRKAIGSDGDRLTGEALQRSLLLEALISKARSDKPLANERYTAAGKLRKLIRQAGPGALEGNPSNGWPNPTLERAYDTYSDLAASIDKANRPTWKYKLIDTLVKATGSAPSYSYWIAIILVTLVVKLITTPFSHLQFETMRNMQRIQPKLDKLRTELADDQQELSRQTWQLMKDNNASPIWSCLALAIQMPFLYLLYQMIRAYEFNFARGEFLWIGTTLSEKVPQLAASLADPDWLLLLLYGVSMYISTRMSAVDKQQADQQKLLAIMMPVMLVVFFTSFPSAFILYWLALNLLTTTQQYFMLKKPVPALAMDEDDLPGAPVAVQDKSAQTSPRGPSPRKRK